MFSINILNCINLQLSIVILEKIDYFRHASSNNVHLLQKFATTTCNFKKMIISDIYHRITYKYINFQQNRVSGSVKTVHTN